MTRTLTMVLAVGVLFALCGCPAEKPAPEKGTDGEQAKPETPETPESPEMPETPETPEIPEPETPAPETPEPETPEPDTPEPEAPEPGSPDPEAPGPVIPGTETVPEAAAEPVKKGRSVRSGDPKTVAFAVGWCTADDPAMAAEIAIKEAYEALGCRLKGLIFFEYFPKTVKNDAGHKREVPDMDKEKALIMGLGLAHGLPTIGCRARSLVNGGTMLKDTVAVLAIGGEAVTCKVAGCELAADRKFVGTVIGGEFKEVPDLKLIVALSEMNLSFDTTEGVSVEDFIRGVLEGAGKNVTLFGGNCMPNDYETDKGGVQFVDGHMLTGRVVAMGIGGPIAVHANHTNEFSPSQETVEVTKAEDKWVIQLDGKPAAEVYRQIRGMKADEEFTSDWQHPIGVVVAPEKVYLRMILDWIDEEGKDRAGKPSELPPGSLQFVAAVPEGTKVKILKGGADPQAILDAAKQGINDSLGKAGDSKPLLALLSDCCARGMRLREFRKADECEVRQAILPAMDEKGTQFPVFGFYAWGELGPIAGEFGGLNCMYQQHTFVSAVVTEQK